MLPVRSSKGQLKIQQMAFVLIAFMILFGIAALFYISVKSSSLRTEATILRHERMQELARKLAASPEFSWTDSECSSCVDLDKLMALRGRTSYTDFWGNIPLLKIKKLYPVVQGRECTKETYPDCSTITLADRKAAYTSEESFVALCRLEGQTRICELGTIVIGVPSV